MLLKIFTIYDSAAGAYLRPFFVPEKAMAVRAFADLANDSDEMVARHPADYTLFFIGEFNDATGRITMRKAFENLGAALTYVKKDRNKNQLELLQEMTDKE